MINDQLASIQTEIDIFPPMKLDLSFNNDPVFTENSIGVFLKGDLKYGDRKYPFEDMRKIPA